MRPFAASVAAAVLALAAAPGHTVEGKLVLYTSQPNQDAQQTVDAFRARHPQVEVEWIRDGTTKVMAKLRAEFTAGAPKPDVLLIADSVTMEGLKREGRLMAYPEAPTAGYPAGVHDPAHHYFGTKLLTTGIVYNTSAPLKPTSWKDLVSPQAKGLVTMPSPLTSGAALIHLASITAHPDLGWAYYEQLAANGARAKGGNGGVLKAVAGGEKLYGVVVDFLPIRAKAKGSPVEFVFPAEGVSAISEPVAILSTAANPEAAKAFVDFLLSMEGQALASAQGYMPAHPKATPPEGFPDPATVKLLPLDAERALADADANKRRFAEVFGE
ncbi:MAG: ABC transporter substrate-binding protein [Ectothiorhodospiraceae bacterium]|nr:ABC transporter substrate-binding protein [Chromatiales bacterium]MCP5157485.1 ABC transporter substrate-binding protein [Ectothiorhodospiraceae bacterium]